MSRYLKVGLESTFGTAATTLVGVRASDVNASVNHEPVYLDSIDGWNPYDAVFGAHVVKLTFTAYAIKDQINPVLNAALGAETDITDATTGAVIGYKYTLDKPMSLTCEYGERISKAYQFLGVIPNQLKVSAKAKAAVTFEVDGIAKSVSEVTYAAPTFDTNLPFVCQKTTVSYGGTAKPVKDFELNINRNIAQDEFVLDEYTLHDIVPGETSIDGSITVLESDVDEFYRALFGDSAATALADEPVKVDIEVKALTPDGSKSMTITIPSVLYPSADYRVRGKNPADKSISFRAVADGLTVVVDA